MRLALKWCDIATEMGTWLGIELAIRPNRQANVAAGFEIAYVTDDPEAAYRKAVAAGASAVKPPALKPWGQTVGYVRDLNGCPVKLCSPVK